MYRFTISFYTIASSHNQCHPLRKVRDNMNIKHLAILLNLILYPLLVKRRYVVNIRGRIKMSKGDNSAGNKKDEMDGRPSSLVL